MDNLDVFAEIVKLIVPPISEVPLHRYYEPGGAGAVAKDSITSMMQTCQLWNGSLADMHAIVWGSLVPAAYDKDSWRAAMQRAGNANVRLVYRWGIPDELVDAVLGRATAIYAGNDHPWRYLGRVLRNRSLPALEVLYLRPDTRGMPRTALRMYGPVRAPLLRICVTSSPLILDAPNLLYLGVMHHTKAQLFTVLQQVPPLRWLSIQSPRERSLIDLTALIGTTSTDRLKFLRISSHATACTPLDTALPPLSCPALEDLDVSGPTWLRAPCLRDACVRNVHAEELLRMLELAQSVETVRARWREVWDSDTPLMAEKRLGPAQPLLLDALTHLDLAGSMSRSTLTFLESISAPHLSGMRLFCDMPPAPDHDALRAVRDDVSMQLAAAQQNGFIDVGDLSGSLSDARTTLLEAGYGSIAHRLATKVGFPNLWNGQAGPSAMDMAATATELVDELQLAFHSDPQPHGGVLLHAVTEAALRAFAVEGNGIGTLNISCGMQELVFEALVGRSGCRLLFLMASTPTNEWGRWYTRSTGDSVISGAARMLHGLRPLRPRRLNVQGGPYGAHTLASEAQTLGEVLQHYAQVEDTHLDCSDSGWQGFPLLSSLSDITVLPGLKKLVLRCASEKSAGWEDRERLQYHINRVDERTGTILAVALRSLAARFERGGELVILELEGGCCLEEGVGRQLQGMAHTLTVSTVCIRPGGRAHCNICGWLQQNTLHAVSETDTVD